MGAASDEIRICTNHKNKEKVPLKGTMAFPGAEYWCPGCGYTHGLLGAGEIVKRTKELDEREEFWLDLGKEYLSAYSATTCSELEYQGKKMTYEELPEEEKTRIQKVIENWKYKF